MRWLDPTHLINTFGVVGMVAVIFAESGLFFGFFLPGESLLVTAGLLASTHRPGAVHLNNRPRRDGRRVLARFVPAVRTFTPIVAGASDMSYRVFVPFNVIGGVLWGVGLPLAGYTLGSRVAHIDRYLVPIIAVVIVVSFIPVAVELRNARRRDVPA
jgi:membrane-associated protein